MPYHVDVWLRDVPCPFRVLLSVGCDTWVNGSIVVVNHMSASCAGQYFEEVRARGLVVGALHTGDIKFSHDRSWYPLVRFVMRNHWPGRARASVDRYFNSTRLLVLPLGSMYHVSLDVPQLRTHIVPASARAIGCSFVGSLGQRRAIGDALRRTGVLPTFSQTAEAEAARTGLAAHASVNAPQFSLLVGSAGNAQEAHLRAQAAGLSPQPALGALCSAFFGAFKHARNLAPEQYRSLVSDSVLTLCPRGSGPDSFRFYEALEMGSVPVVVRDTHAELWDAYGSEPCPLPRVRSWATARPVIQQLLQREGLDELQARVLRWWAQWKAAYRQDVAHVVRESLAL